ncbi:MAG: sigma factor-like helix-turn-helix DNA-binding protein, partial [Clostridia bacterium]
KLIKIIFKKNKGKNRKLTKKQRTVILERFGLLDGDEKGFVEIAKKYNLTRSNISLLYKNGIENIRKELYKTSNEVQQN